MYAFPDLKPATTIFVVWLLGLIGLALTPATSAADLSGETRSGVVYSLNDTQTLYQDPSGTYSVPVRTLRAHVPY